MATVRTVAALPCLLLLLASASLPSFCAAAEADADVDLSTLRVKELKRLLEERGVECEGCVEKDHVLSKVRESMHLPVLSPEEIQALKAAKSGKASSGGGGGGAKGTGEEGGGAGGAWAGSRGEDYSKDMEMQEILKKLNLGKYGDKVKMFSAKDFEKYADTMKETKEAYEKGEL